MAQPDGPVRTTVTHDTAEVRREELRESARQNSNTGWWVAALVAIVAVVGLFFMFGGQRANNGEIQAAREAGQADATLDSATQRATVAAATATEAAQDAAESTAVATQAAAENAQAAAERTAEATQAAAAEVGQAAEDAAASTPPVE